MKINLEELFEKRWSLGWSYNEGSIFTSWNSVDDEMVNAAISEGNGEFAVILSPQLLKRVKCECKFPCLKNFFVTGVFNLWRLDWFNKKKKDNKNSFDYSLITFSKDKPKKIRICIAPEILYDDKIKSNQKEKYCKAYYKELESYINTSKIPESLKSLVNEIAYSDYREEVFDARYYSKRFLKIAKALKKQKFVLLEDLVEIIDLKKREVDNSKWFKTLDYKLQDSLYPLNEKKLEAWRVFFPIKKGDIVVSEEGRVYLFADDSKIVVSLTGSNAVLRLKSTWVTPEYLFLYMNSGIFEDVNYLSKIMLKQDMLLTNWTDLEKLPVYLPKSNIPMLLDKNESQKYRDIFDQHYRPFLMMEKEADNAHDEMEGLEEMKDGKLVSDPDANDWVVECLWEVNQSLSHGIYRSAITSIGAVLEAFLTDWLCEIDGNDYFRDSIGITYIHGKEKYLDLSFREAIDRVLKWLTVSKEKKENIRQKVENIRYMRDCVHARVYLKHKIKLTSSVCETALKDLEEIIRLRYYNFQMASFMKTIAIE